VLAVSASGEVRGHSARVGRTALAGRVAALRRALRVARGGRGMELLEPAGWSPAPPGAEETLLRDLHRELVEPLADALPPDGATLAIEPHDVLWLVPFAALRSGGGRWFGDRWPLLHTPSAPALDELRSGQRRDHGAGQALIVGSPIVAPVSVRWQGLNATFAPLRG